MKLLKKHGFKTVKHVQMYVTVMAALLASSLTLNAQSPRFSGQVYSDYYHVVSSNVDDLAGQNGLWFRRIYLTMDQSVNENWSTRLRMEMAQPGDFKTKSKMEPFVKDAYLKWKGEKQEILIGISRTPTFGLAEGIWGYRSVEKTPLNLYKFGSSRDVGVAVKGEFGTDNVGAYHIMLANGSSNKSEHNKGKKAMVSLQFKPADGFTVEVYGDFESVSEDTDNFIVRGAAFFVKDAGRFGVEFTRKTVQTEGVDDESFDVFSFFAVGTISDRATAFARFDHQFQENPKSGDIAYFPFATASETNFIIAGVDYAVARNVHFIPNIEVALYTNDEGDAPDPDVMARMTVYYKF